MTCTRMPRAKGAYGVNPFPSTRSSHFRRCRESYQLPPPARNPFPCRVRAFAGTGVLLCCFYHLSLFIVGEQEANRSVTNSSHVLTHRRAGYSGPIPGGKSRSAPACSPGTATTFGSLQHPPSLWHPWRAVQGNLQLSHGVTARQEDGKKKPDETMTLCAVCMS